MSKRKAKAAVAEQVEEVKASVVPLPYEPPRLLVIHGLPIDELWRMYGDPQIELVVVAVCELWPGRVRPHNNVLRPLEVDGVTLSAAQIAEALDELWPEAAALWREMTRYKARRAAISLMCRVATRA
jgi:hypothetical protein